MARSAEVVLNSSMDLGITNLRHIGLFTPNISEQAGFYSEVWGLQVVFARQDAIYLRGLSAEFYLLSLHASTRKGIHHVAFAAANEDCVNSAAETLKQANVPVVAMPGVLDEPGGGYGFCFMDPDGRCIEISSGVAAHR